MIIGQNIHDLSIFRSYKGFLLDNKNPFQFQILENYGMLHSQYNGLYPLKIFQLNFVISQDENISYFAITRTKII